MADLIIHVLGVSVLNLFIITAVDSHEVDSQLKHDHIHINEIKFTTYQNWLFLSKSFKETVQPKLKMHMMNK